MSGMCSPTTYQYNFRLGKNSTMGTLRTRDGITLANIVVRKISKTLLCFTKYSFFLLKHLFIIVCFVVLPFFLFMAIFEAIRPFFAEQ